MTKVKVLSLLQPWAHLVVIGAKGIETRSWSTKYRGTLLIHASKKFTKEQAKLCQQWPFNEYITNLEEIERGYIIGAVELYNIRSTTAALADMKNSETERVQEEYRFGNYAEGRFAWYLRHAIEFNEMIPHKGSLILQDYEIEHPLIGSGVKDHAPDLLAPDKHEFADRMAGYQKLK